LIFGNWILWISRNFITISGALATYTDTLGLYGIKLLVAFLLQRMGGIQHGYWDIGIWETALLRYRIRMGFL
jgi:membrane protein required for beta-lactamase induction